VPEQRFLRLLSRWLEVERMSRRGQTLDTKKKTFTLEEEESLEEEKRDMQVKRWSTLGARRVSGKEDLQSNTAPKRD
jgi:hypothetical protein